jgi:P-type Cu2+ transporter
MTADVSSFDPSTASAPGCAHCGLEVAAGRTDPTASRQFCCDGCSTVWAVLHQSGLDQYYRLRSLEGAKPVQPSAKSYDELDDPALRATCCRPLPGGLLAAELYLEGVHCSACVWLVERLPSVVPGVAQATLDVGRSLVEIVFSPGETTLGAIARTLDSFGYPPHPRHGASEAERRRREDRALLVRIAVAGAAAGNAMLMAFALYGGAFAGIDPDHERLLRFGSLAVTVPAVLYSGSTFFRGALAAVRTRTPHVDLPLAIGIAAGFIHGAFSTLRGSGDVYFDSITILIFLLLSGRFIERRQTRAARDAAALLGSLAPSSARKLDERGAHDVPIEALRVGDLVEIRAGEHVPADGVVVDGESSIDRSLLTGEARPERVGVGHRVHAGCVNLARRLQVEVEASGAATRVGKLVESMQRAAARRAPIVRLADRVAGKFVVAVLVAAAICFGSWLSIDPSRAIDHTIALLVVSCPCALGMATPLAVSAALGRAAKRGILIKGGEALEVLAHPGLLVFDKTGTLTEGRLRVVAWEGDRKLEPIVAAIEAHSAHPIAAALVRAHPGAGEHALADVRQTLGGGLEAMLDGKPVVVGSPSFVAARVASVPDWASRAVATHAALAHTPVLVAVDGQVQAVAALGDPLRSDVPESLEALRGLGWELAILSGDHPDAVSAVGRQLGIARTMGGVSPEQKLELIERERAQGPVVMVGDGVNDSAALSASSVGIAVHGGAEASLEAAHVFTTRGGIGPVVELIAASGRTLAVIRRGIAFSLLYNLVGVALALAGLLEPLLAAVLMPLSSLTVISNAYRSRTFPR